MAGRLLSGHGTPEGAQHAGKGALYQDVAPAGAGKVYRKITASGNTGWTEVGASGGGSYGPIVILRRTAGTDEAPSGIISWNSTVADTSSGALWTVSNPTQLLAPVSGIYKLTVKIEVYNSGGGLNIFTCSAYANGNPADRQYQLDQRNGDLPTLTTYVSTASIDYVMAAGEYIEVRGDAAGGGITYTQTTTHQNPAQPPRISWQQVA